MASLAYSHDIVTISSDVAEGVSVVVGVGSPSPSQASPDNSNMPSSNIAAVLMILMGSVPPNSPR